jgi:hypothetical protein
MPKLLIFAACEEVITDEVGIISLNRIIERVELKVPSELQLPPRAHMRWEAVSMWSLDETEVGLYEQVMELLTAGGTVTNRSISTALELAPSAPGTSSTIISKGIYELPDIPITEGRLELRLSYRKIGDPKWIPAATYPVEVTVVRQ